jgi:hypothetical protein
MSAVHSRITDPVLRRVVQPQNILEIGMAFWSTRVVVAAVEFGVFTQLAAGPLSGQELMDKLGWRPQAAGPVLDALVVLGLLRRERAGRYSNSRRAALFVVRAKPSYLGALMGLSSRRLFNSWSGFGDLLQTGRPGAAEEYVESFALSERLRFIPGDMHHGPLPTAHVICLGHVLHGYAETKRRELFAKAYDAVPIGGAVIVYGAWLTPLTHTTSRATCPASPSCSRPGRGLTPPLPSARTGFGPPDLSASRHVT